MDTVREWVVYVEKAVINMEDVSKESELKKNRCIYNIPDYIRELDNKACKPQVVSLGPYHHYNNPNLEAMEKHKGRALFHFLKRSKKTLTLYFDALAKEVKDLKEAFEHPEWLGDDGEFVQMMILDGCFILEILRTPGDYAADVSIFSGNGYLTEMPLISRDMLLLENQVPLRVLEILVVVEDMGQDKHAVINSILRFFGLDRQRSQSMDKGGLHILDVCRRGLVVEPPWNKRKLLIPREGECEIDIIPSATELHEAGIRFKTSKTTSLKDITFKGSTLHFRPIVVVTDDTKSFFLNLMAFEKVHVGAGYEVTSYVYFMGCLIKSGRDASLLRSVGIVPGALGSDEDVAQLFRLISKNAMLNPDHSALVRVFNLVTKKLRNRVRMRLSAWRLDLLQNYMKSPWGVVSAIAATIIFTLTTIQTVFTVLSYTNPKK